MSRETIPLDQCIKGRLYKVGARNFTLAVFNGDDGFIGVRKKFSYTFPSTEYH